MTITVPLTTEEEAKLVAMAEGRGVSPDTFIIEAVKEILERSQLTPASDVQAEDRERRLAELFSAFYGMTTPPGIREEAFHRENWYR
jgi:hypothetical protein